MTDLASIGQAPASVECSGRQRIGVRFEIIEPAAVLADGLVIVASSVLGGILYHVGVDSDPGDIAVNAGLGLLASLIYSAVAHAFGLYRMNQLLEGERDSRRVLASWTLANLILAVVLFLLKSGADVSRGSFIFFYLLGSVGLACARHVAKHVLKSAHQAGELRGRRVILIGTPDELSQFTQRELLTRFGLEEIERVALSTRAVGHSCKLDMAQMETMLQRVRDTAVEEIVVAASWSKLAQFDGLFEQLRIAPLPVRLLPDRAAEAVFSRQISPALRWNTIELQRAPLSRLECLAKRLLDIVVAAAALLLLWPILLLAAAAVKLESRGPVIFRQRRHGFNGRPFIIYKLRTMSVMEDGATVVQAREKDPRVTRVGRLLRETSIDELPQLWNVLRGDMSIVGPRPHALAHDYEYGKMIANYAFRHHVKPGITGWAQVLGFRGGTPQLELMQQRIKHDLWYIDNWGLLLDIYIMVRTVFELLRKKNAY